MSAQRDALEADRWVLMATAVASAIFLWRAAFDPFSLPKATVVAVGALAIFCLGLNRVVADGTVTLPRSPHAVVAAVFLAGLLLATATSDRPLISIVGYYKRYGGLVLYGSCVLLFIAVLRAFTGASIRRFSASLLVAGGAVVIYGSMQWIGLEPYKWQNLYGDAVFSTLGNPNFAGAYAGFSLPLALWGVTNTGWSLPWRAASGVVALAAVATAVASKSFQGPATLVLAGAVFALAWALHRGGTVRRIGVPVLLSGGAVAGVALLAGFAGTGPLDRLGEQNTLQLREYYWGAAASMFADDPLTGVGLDRYAAHYRSQRSEEAALKSEFTVSADAPHNVPLDMFAEGGLPLGLGYLAFVGLTLWVIITGLVRLRGPDLLLLGALAGAWAAYQAQSLVSIDVAPLAAAHWLLAGAIVVVAGPPQLVSVRLPWAPRPVVGKKRGTRVPRRSKARERGGAIAAALIAIVGLWLVTRPLRADVAHQDARKAAAARQAEAADAAGERSTSIAPWEPTFWFRRGVLTLDSGRERQAAPLLEEAIRRDPLGLEQVVTAARVYGVLDDPERAGELYDRALRIEPHAPELKVEVARFKLAQGDFDAGIPLAEELVKARPDNADFWLLLGKAYTADGQESEARDALERALELSPDNAEAKATLEKLDG